MNRLILRYGAAVTIVILAIFAWVVGHRIASGGLGAITVLAFTAIPVWIIGSGLFIAFWPRIAVGGFKRLILKRGFGGGPIALNSLYAVPDSPSQSASSGSVIATGADDLVYLGGWLDLREGPRLLHVPEMRNRYYSVQFTDPGTGANVAYVGTRATGSAAGTFLVCNRRWPGQTPPGAIRIDVPHRAALLIGRVFVADENDRAAAFALAQQIRLSRVDADR